MKINITKRFLLSLCLMTLTLLCGENKAWGQATATLTFGTNNVKINAATVFATDTQDNTWTITTVGTTSFTPQPTYSQVGSGEKPATSITFTTTLPSKSTITDFSAKFGGFKGTAGTITLKVDDTQVGTGSLNEKDDVTVNNTSNQLGQKLTITITDIAKGVKCYNISVTYQEASTPTPTPAPTFSLTEGTYNGPKHVTITAPDGYTEGIVYTIDGSDPTTSGTAKDYSDAGIDINTTTTLRAVAYDSEMNCSGEAKATYTITYNAPTFSLAGGTYYGDQSVSISVKDLGTGSILYTTNGDDPKTKGTKYTEAISLPVGTKLTLKAVAKYGEEFSKVTEATYDIQKKSPSFYQRITSAAELTANETYLIVCERESESVAFGKISNKKGSKQDVTITGDKINLSAAGTGTPTEFILEKSNESGYLLKNASTEAYITTPDKTEIIESETGTNLTITFNSDGTANIVGISGRCIWYGISQGVFGNYATTNTNGYAKVYLFKKHVVKEFSDTEDLRDYLPGTALADQTITLNRNLYSGWNTFCVPFALTQAQLEEAYGSGAVAKYLSGVTTGAEGATLHFAPENGRGIEANKAYLLYLTADVTEAKTFSGVTLEPVGACTTTVSTEGGDYTFQGILKPTTLETDDTQYFLNSLGTDFVLPSNSTSAMKATRAYITVPAASATAQGRQYSFDFNGTTTGIDNVNISGLEDGAWYTISGIRVNRPAAKGVYIHNGRKVIVK